MKTTRNWKAIVCLLLGLITIAGRRGFAADIQWTSFDKLAASLVRDQFFRDGADGASVGPFMEEGPVTTVAGPALGQENIYAPPCCDGAACGDDEDCFMGAPGRFWFQADYMHWWTSGSHVPPLVATTQTAGPPFQTVFGDQDVSKGDHDGYRIDFGNVAGPMSPLGRRRRVFRFHAGGRSATTAAFPTATPTTALRPFRSCGRCRHHRHVQNNPVAVAHAIRRAA